MSSSGEKVVATKSFDDDLILGSQQHQETDDDGRARASTLDNPATSLPPASPSSSGVGGSVVRATGVVSSDDEGSSEFVELEDGTTAEVIKSDKSVDSKDAASLDTASSDSESDDDDDIDEEIKLAKLMAVAFAEHPTLSPEQIKKMVQEKLQKENEAAKKRRKNKRSRLKKVGGKVSHGAKKAGKGIKKVAKSAMPSSAKKKSKEAAAALAAEGSAEMTLIPTPEKDKRKSAPAVSSEKEGATTRRKSSSGKALVQDDVSSVDEVGVAAADQVQLTGVVWKRRSGLGKYSVSAAWERRRIVLKGNKLYYFKTLVDDVDGDDVSEDGINHDAAGRTSKSWLETATAKASAAVGAVSAAANVVQEEARGNCDLVKEEASVAASAGHSGAPTPFALSIKVQGQTKWKFCFDSHAELMEWLASLTDVVVQSSVDAYNSQILQANDPTVDKSLSFQGQLSEPPLIAHSGDARAGGHRLWVTGSYKIASADMAKRDLNALEEVPSSDEEEFESNAVAPRSKVAEPPRSSSAKSKIASNSGELNVDPEAMKHIALVFNAVILLSRASTTSVDTFWYLITFSNIALFALLSGKISLVKKTDAATETTAIASASPGTAAARGSTKEESEKATSAKKKSVPAEVKTVAAKGGFIPTAGTTTMQIKNPTDLPVNKDGHVFAGWRATDPGEMEVRSHGYLSSKKKVKSPGQLYDCVHVDIFEHPTRVPDMAGRVKLPKIDYGDIETVKTWNAPDIFVISIALPTDPPKLYSSSDDGGGYTITLYFAMAKDTREILKRVTADGYDPKSEKIDDPQKSKVNAVRLFDEWCRRAPTDDKFMSRFKVVPNAQNLKEIGMPSWISKYNGKPFLIKRPGQTGFLYRHPELSAMEFDISLHPFPYLAKQGICFMKDSYFKRVLVSFGFVIEGRGDDELPECLIGLMQLCYPDPIHAIQGEDFFAGRSARSH